MKITKLFSIIVLIIFLSLSVFALPNTYSNTFDFQSGNRGAYFFNYLEYDGESYVYTGSDGKYEAPKICDIDEDGLKEVVVNVGTGLVLYSGASENYVEEETIPSPITGYTIEDFVCLKDVSADETRILLFLNDGTNYHIGEFLYNSGALISSQLIYSGSDSENYAMQTNINCAEYTSGSSYAFTCAYVPQEGSTMVVISNDWDDSSYSVKRINATYDDRIIKAEGNHSVYVWNTLTDLEYFTPMVGKFGHRIVFPDMSNLSYGGAIYMIDTDDCSFTDNYCNADETDAISELRKIGVAYNPARILQEMTKLDYNGEEIFCYGWSNITSRVGCVGNDGVVYFDYTMDANAGDYIISSYPIAYDLNNDGFEELMLSVSYNNRGAYKLLIYDIQGSSALYVPTANSQFVLPLYSGYNNATHSIVGIYNVTSGKYFNIYFNQSGSLNYYPLTDSNLENGNGFVKYDDISGDGINEFIFQTTSGTEIYFTKPQDPSTITIYGTGFYGFYSEDNCIDGSLTIKMKECIDTLDCTYSTNNPDIEETEKLCGTCGGTQTYSCGSYSLSNPQFICYNLTSVGSNAMTFDFYTNANEEIPATTLNLTIDMASGTAGVDCDKASFVINPPTIGGTESEEEETDSDTPDGTTTLDPENPASFIQNNLSFFWRIVFGCGIIIGLMYSVGSYAGNSSPALLGIVGVIGFIMVTALGFFPVYLLVIGVVAVILFIVVSLYVR